MAGSESKPGAGGDAALREASDAARAVMFGRRAPVFGTRDALEADFRRVGLSEADARRAATQLEAGQGSFELIARQRAVFSETRSRVNESAMASVLEQRRVVEESKGAGQ